MVTIVFGGPSLKGIDCTGQGVTVLPPARQGDLLKAVREMKPRAVGLLDCDLPYRSLPTWHKEILHVLAMGVPVVGAAAVGAHRAAELAFHGMEGAGSIFRRVASGELERDDEILCDWQMGPEGLKVLSVPLVSMRDAIAAASEEGILSERVARLLAEKAEVLFWRHRTWEALLDEARKDGFDEEELKMFRSWLPQAPDPVRADAVELLERLQELRAGAVESEGERHDAGKGEDSSLFQSLDRRDRPVSSSSGPVRQWRIGDMVTFAHPEAEDLNGRALNRKLSLLLAARWDMTPDDREIEAERARIRRRFKLKTDGDMARWMEENDLDEPELRRLLEEEALLHHLHRWLMQGRIHGKNTGAILDELKLRGGYPEWKEKAARRESVIRRNEGCLMEQKEQASRTPFMTLLREHLRAEGFPWFGTLLPEALPETGMEFQDLLDEMITARAARTILGRAFCPHDSGGTAKGKD